MLSYDLTVAVEGQSDLYVQLLVCMCNDMRVFALVQCREYF